MSEKSGLEKYPGMERLDRMNRERARIEAVAAKYLGAEKARVFADNVMKKALEADDLIGRIRSHPKVQGRFGYNGVGFTPKEKAKEGYFYRVFDGLHILEDLKDNVLELELEKKDNTGAAFILEWLENEHVRFTRRRLENLEEYGTIKVLSPREIEEEIRRQDIAEDKAPGSKAVN